jgi:anti-sigma regulatory factor (Ser/Thr protein kinase)
MLLELPAAHSAARMACQVVRQFAVEGGIRGKEVETMVLVASELLSNAVDHGGGGSAMVEEDLAEPVRMTLEVTLLDDRWELAVADQGGGDPAELRALLGRGMPDLEDERGRGLYLLESMLTSLGVERSPDGKGIVVTAVRQRGKRK